MEIINKHNYCLPVELEDCFTQVYKIFLNRFNLRKNLNVEVAVIRSGAIRELNKIYRSKDSVTDVLSFPMNPIESEDFLGSIYFCYSVIKKKYENILFGFCFLFAHSLLHLIGYEHSPEMFSIQDEIINQVFKC